MRAAVFSSCRSEHNSAFSAMDDSLLHIAVQRDRTDEVEFMLKNGYSANILGIHGQTPLHVAASNNSCEIVKVLLKYGASTNIVCTSGPNQGYNPLHLALKQGFVQVAEHFVNYGASVNASTSKYGYTPLHLAAQTGSAVLVEKLISLGAKVNVFTPENKSALYLAAEGGHGDACKRLLLHGADASIQFNTLTIVHLAVATRKVQLLKALLECNVGVNGTSNFVTPLHLAAYFGDSVMCEMLLKKGANVNACLRNKHTPLSLALLERRSSLHDEIETALKLCPVKVTPKSRTWELCRSTVEVLLKYGARTDYVTNDGCSGASGFVSLIRRKNCSVETIKLAIKYGADVNLQASFLYVSGSPLLEAVRCCRFDVVKLLLENRANVHAKGEQGEGVFHRAAEKDFVEVVKLLVKWGADINSRNSLGDTALHVACKQTRLKCVGSLLDHGSDLTLATREKDDDLGLAAKCTPLRIAYHIAKTSTANDSLCDKKKVYVHIAQEILKMKIAGLPVVESDWKSLSGVKELEKLRLNYEKEVARMKSELIADSCVTYFSLLTRSNVELEKIMGNGSIVATLLKLDYKSKFPAYARMIYRRVKNAVRRRLFVSRGTCAIERMTALPEFITERIARYLSNAELITFLKTFPSASKRVRNDSVMSVSFSSQSVSFSC